MHTPCALRIYAGPRALAHVRAHGLAPDAIRVVAAAAGGPKGLVLNALDRLIFARWLADANHPVHLVGASIGAWRMASATLPAPGAALARMAHEYIHQTYRLAPGRILPTPAQVTHEFGLALRASFESHAATILAHERYRLHIVTTRGRHILAREGRLRTPIGYMAATLSNAVNRKALGAWLERVVFSAPGEPLPVDLRDLRHRIVALTPENLCPALLASCSVPFALKAVHDIPGAPRGAYWDGGITDYHLHWNYRDMTGGGLVLYPHFQRSVVPGWLDKPWRHRHRPTPGLDNVIVLAPDPAWVQALPGRKLPDRGDFKTYATDIPARIACWSRVLAESECLAEEFAQWLERPDHRRMEPL